VLLVAVNTLSEFFDQKIKTKASLLARENGQGHTVFLYCPQGSQGSKEEKTATVYSTQAAYSTAVPFPSLTLTNEDYPISPGYCLWSPGF